MWHVLYLPIESLYYVLWLSQESSWYCSLAERLLTPVFIPGVFFGQNLRIFFIKFLCRLRILETGVGLALCFVQRCTKFKIAGAK